jgi:hypothetical protein
MSIDSVLSAPSSATVNVMQAKTTAAQILEFITSLA